MKKGPTEDTLINARPKADTRCLSRDAEADKDDELQRGCLRAWVWQDGGRAADRRREGLMRRREAAPREVMQLPRNTNRFKCSPISAVGPQSATERLSTSNQQFYLANLNPIPYHIPEQTVTQDHPRIPVAAATGESFRADRPCRHSCASAATGLFDAQRVVVADNPAAKASAGWVYRVSPHRRSARSLRPLFISTMRSDRVSASS